VRRLSVTLVALLAACGGGEPIRETDLLLSVTAGASEVELGKPFPLTVVRVWQKDLVPDEWSDRALAPLALKLEEETRRDDGTRVEETRRYLAHAFSTKDVVIPGLKLAARPRDKGPERKVSASGFRIRVKRALDPENPGPPELPGEAPPRRGWFLVTGGALALIAVLFLALRRRPRAPAPAPAVAPPAPPRAHERALGRLRGATIEEAADVVREYVAEAKGIRALERTTEELLAAIPSPALRGVLGPADLAKFAAHVATEAERERVLVSAEAFIRETAG
jgi:hypothetical protein